MKSILGLLFVCFLSCNAKEDGDLKGPTDLSWSYDEYAKECPGDQDFQFLKQLVIKEGVWHALNTFAVAEHCGTHIDAPYHFNPEGLTVEQIPLEKLLVTGVFIDASKETGEDVNYTMPLSKIKDWEKENGEIPDNSVVIVRLGWASKYQDKTKYYGKNDKGYAHPGIAPEVSQYLIDSKKVVGVGVDCSSVDPGFDDKFKSHVILTKAGLYILENIALKSSLPPKFKLIVAPMKIGKGTGAPVRLIALPNDYKC